MTENLDIPITETPKPKRGWPKGRKRGPRKPKEAPQSAPEKPVEAPPRPEPVEVASSFIPKRKRARKPRYPVSLTVDKKTYRGNEIAIKLPYAVIYDNKGQEVVFVGGKSFRLEGAELMFAKSVPKERGYDAPPAEFPVTGTIGAVMPRVASMAERETALRSFKEQQRRELEQSQGPEAFG